MFAGDLASSYRFWFSIVLRCERFYNVCRPTCWIHNWFTTHGTREYVRLNTAAVTINMGFGGGGEAAAVAFVEGPCPALAMWMICVVDCESWLLNDEWWWCWAGCMYMYTQPGTHIYVTHKTRRRATDRTSTVFGIWIVCALRRCYWWLGLTLDDDDSRLSYDYALCLCSTVSAALLAAGVRSMLRYVMAVYLYTTCVRVASFIHLCQAQAYAWERKGMNEREIVSAVSCSRCVVWCGCVRVSYRYNALKEIVSLSVPLTRVG